MPGIATQSICADLLGILKEILSYGIGGLYARHGRVYNVFLHEPFFVDSLNRAVLEENLSIKTVSETFLCHFIGNVNYLAWPDPMPDPMPVPCPTPTQNEQKSTKSKPSEQVSSGAKLSLVVTKVALGGIVPGAVPESLTVTVSSDSRHMAYVVVRANTAFVVRDGLESAKYTHIVQGSLQFSPKGNRLAWTAHKGNKRVVVVDGEESSEYEAVGKQVAFSADGRHVGFFADRGRTRPTKVAVVDGTPLGPYDGIADGSFAFSTSGDHFAFVAKRAEKTFVVLDGHELTGYDAIGEGLTFDSSGASLAYVAKRGTSMFVVVNGKEGREYEAIAEAPIFSPDGSRLAYIAIRAGKRLVVVDGSEGKAYDGVGTASLRFSPNNRHVAYMVEQGGKKQVVVDGSEGKAYDDIGEIMFSSDGEHLSYGARIGDKTIGVVDEREVGREYTNAGAPVLSFARKRVAFRAAKDHRQIVVLDGIAGAKYDKVHDLVFGPNGGHLAYWGRRGDKSILIVNTVQAGEYDNSLSKSKIVFDGPTSLHALAIRGIDFLRIEVTIKTAA